MKTVLITAIGSFAADAVIRKCREYGLRTVGTDIYPQEWHTEGSEVDRFFRIPRADSGEAYLRALEEIIAAEEVSCLIPLTDAEIDVLNDNRERLSPALLCISPEEAIRTFRNKRRSTAAAQRILENAGVQDRVRTIPETDLQAAGDLRFPLVLKPADGRSSEGVYRVRNRNELNYACACISGEAGKPLPARYMAQPLIAGSVITADIVRDSFGHCVVIPREELLRTLNGAGLSVRVFRDGNLERVCRLLADGFGVIGCVNMEFIREEGSGVLWFLECNPHFSGGTAFSVTAGYDTVGNHLRALTGLEIDREVKVSECWLVKKYVEVKTKP